MDLASVASSSLRSRPWRSGALGLPVALGVAAIVASFGAVASARADLAESLGRLGADQVHVTAPVRDDGEGLPKLPAAAVARAQLLDEVRVVSAVAEQPDHQVRASMVADPLTPIAASTVVMAADADLPAAVRADLAAGRFLAAVDEARAADVVVVGSVLARAYAIDRPGEVTLLIDDRAFLVVGVLEPVPSYPLLDRAVLVPFATAARRWGDDGRPTEIVARTEPELAEPVAEALPVLVTFGDGPTPTAQTAAELVAARDEVDDTMGLLVAASGGLALVLGAFGIAFALWAAVLARTSEIGIRRALGATRLDITLQFLMETAFVGVLAAAVGALLGPLAAAVIADRQGWPTEVDWTLVAATAVLAVELTVVAGLLPARRAARLEPLGALRT